jgi:hypothetical protein
VSLRNKLTPASRSLRFVELVSSLVIAAALAALRLLPL